MTKELIVSREQKMFDNIMQQFTSEQAKMICESEVWKEWPYENKVKLQAYQKMKLMDFNFFKEAMERVLGERLSVSDFLGAFYQGLRKQLEKLHPRPTFEEIIALLPEKMRKELFG